MALVKKLNADPAVHGILVQLPLPKQIDAQQVLDAIDPAKDVDGFHPVNAGRLASGLPALVPCTPLGCIMLAKTVHPSLAGLEAVVIGRSNIVGKPVTQLLLAENATVTVTHSKTRDLPAVCRRADLLVAAIGRPEMVRGDWIKPGATVIDVGINRVPGANGKSKLVGDVAFAECAAGRGRDHAGAGRRRADDHRLPDGQHRARGLRDRGIAGAGGLKLQRTRYPSRFGKDAVAPLQKTKSPANAGHARSNSNSESVIPGEGDLIEALFAETLRGAGDRLAAERLVELHRRIVVRQRPDHEAFQSALGEVAARRGEQPAAEAQALVLRAQIELVDLAFVEQAARAVAAVVGVPGYLVAEGEDGDAAAFADRAVPPVGAAARHQLFEFQTRG